jgi:hypothetical protein
MKLKSEYKYRKIQFQNHQQFSATASTTNCKPRQGRAMENSRRWIPIRSFLFFFLLISCAQSRPIAETMTHQKHYAAEAPSELSRHVAEKLACQHAIVEEPTVISANLRHPEGSVPENYFEESKRQSPGGPDPEHH